MRLSLFALLSVIAFASFAEDSKIAELFARAGVDGTLILESVATGERLTHNEARATEPFIAASTFKVLNTLIAIENGVIASPESPIQWDGKAREIPAWNQDQTLRTAFQVSCVWC